mmetsp:Transcript_28776/g.82683  ORF Transcript_28776/g.82683 Transcript_28776/m.82683 type:complete len:117 (+) Transcript_28776:382-732(+)
MIRLWRSCGKPSADSPRSTASDCRSGSSFVFQTDRMSVALAQSVIDPNLMFTLDSNFKAALAQSMVDPNLKITLDSNFKVVHEHTLRDGLQHNITCSAAEGLPHPAAAAQLSVRRV